MNTINTSTSLGSQIETNSDKYAFYRSIGSPKFIVAPMVDQSELPYRMLTRKYKAQLCYTPMFHSRLFSESESYRKEFFAPHPEDRPLAVQFCGNDPDILLKAAKMVENDCDAVDINFGCPQGIAKRGKYGSFLLEKTELIRSLVTTLAKNLKVPVICKMRCLPSEQQTLALARVMEESGCNMLVLHGRTREHKKNDIKAANWYMIKRVKEALNIPVIANGGLATYDDCMKCLEYTGCDGVMSSESILEYPALFDNSQIYDLDQIALEYLDMTEKYKGEADLKIIKSHTHKFLHAGLKIHTDLRDKLVEAQNMDDVKSIVKEMRVRRAEVPPQNKIQWYYRYWNSMKIERGNTQTYTFEKWDEFIQNDPIFNKKLKAKPGDSVKNDNILNDTNEDMCLGSLLNEEKEQIKARIKMFGDENIDDEDFLLSSPKILVNTQEEEDKDDQIFFNHHIKEKSEKNPNWTDFQIDTILGQGAYGKVFKVYKKTQPTSHKKMKFELIPMNDNNVDLIPQQAPQSGRLRANTTIGFSKVSKLLSPTEVKKTAYVIKELFTDQMPREMALQAMEEISILGSLSSPYIVTYIDSFISDTKVNIIMEFCEHGDLQTFIMNRQKSTPQQGFTEQIIWRFFIQICLGVNYLLSKGILHRDLKALNIFVCKDNQVKIGDLGVARRLAQHSNLPSPNKRNKIGVLDIDEASKSFSAIDQTTKVGTPFYLAPEIWEEKPYTDKSDIWSLGVILYELCTFKKPFMANSMEELKQKVLNEKPIPINNPNLSKELVDLTLKLMRKNPDQRPSIKEIIQSNIFKNKAKQFKFELPTFKNKITQNQLSIQQPRINNYTTNNKSQQNGIPQRPISNLIQKKELGQNQTSQKSIGIQNTPYQSSSNQRANLKENANLSKIKNVIEQVSPKQCKPVSKINKGLDEAAKDQKPLLPQKSIDSFSNMFSKIKSNVGMGQTYSQKKNQDPKQNISQTSFNSVSSHASSKNVLSAKKVNVSTINKNILPLKEVSHHFRKPTATTNNTVNLSYQCDTIKELIKKEREGESDRDLPRTQRERNELHIEYDAKLRSHQGIKLDKDQNIKSQKLFATKIKNQLQKNASTKILRKNIDDKTPDHKNRMLFASQMNSNESKILDRSAAVKKLLDKDSLQPTDLNKKLFQQTKKILQKVSQSLDFKMNKNQPKNIKKAKVDLHNDQKEEQVTSEINKTTIIKKTTPLSYNIMSQKTKQLALNSSNQGSLQQSQANGQQKKLNYQTNPNQNLRSKKHIPNTQSQSKMPTFKDTLFDISNDTSHPSQQQSTINRINTQATRKSELISCKAQIDKHRINPFEEDDDLLRDQNAMLIDIEDDDQIFKSNKNTNHIDNDFELPEISPNKSRLCKISYSYSMKDEYNPFGDYIHKSYDQQDQDMIINEEPMLEELIDYQALKQEALEMERKDNLRKSCLENRKFQL